MAKTKEKKPIDTARVPGRRQIRFASITDLAIEIDRIVAAEKAGRLGRVGNWTAGQIFGHLAKWIEMSYEGFPFRVPGLVRFFARMSKRRLLRDGLKPGMNLPKSALSKIGEYPDMPVEDGALRFKKALARLKAGEIPPHESPAFGKLTLDEWVQLHLRHAELHLSFLHP
ncbi:MAG: DUF1569 domain-containing protein [Phycisphaerales bacterium]